MNTLQDTLNTLLPDAKKLLEECIIPASRKCFEEDGEVHPYMFSVRPDGKPQIYNIPVMDDETKPAIWEALRMARRGFPIVAFISEVWMLEDRKAATENMLPDGSCKIMPRDHPLKTEAVMISLFQGKRTVNFRADIRRNPTKLEEYRVFYDSQFPGKDCGADAVQGAMVDGDPYPMEDN